METTATRGSGRLARSIHRVTASFQACGLSAHVVVAFVCRSCGPLSRVKACLAGRPLMAFELVLRLLVRALTIFRIGDDVGWRAAATAVRRRRLVLYLLGRRNRLVLLRVGVVNVIRVVRVVIRDSAPVIRI